MFGHFLVWMLQAKLFTVWLVPGSVNVYVNLQPTIAVGQNLVVDISRSVVCRNDAPTHRNDNVMMLLVRCMVGLYLTLLVLFDTMALPILFH